MENDIWFNSDMWFNAEDVSEVTTSDDGAYVRLFTGDNYVINYTNECAIVTRTRPTSSYSVHLSKVHVMGQIAIIVKYKSQKNRRPAWEELFPDFTEPIVMIRMAIGGDGNINEVMYPVELNLRNATSTKNSPGLTHVNFKNGAKMSYGNNQITYTDAKGNSTYAMWASQDELYKATMYLTEMVEWEGVIE